LDTHRRTSNYILVEKNEDERIKIGSAMKKNYHEVTRKIKKRIVIECMKKIERRKDSEENK